VTARVNQTRVRLLERFDIFLNPTGLCLHYLYSFPLLLAALLCAYGKHLFRTMEPKYVFSETINAIQETHTWIRPLMAGPWKFAKRWTRLEPSHTRAIIPIGLFRAAIVVALLLGWEAWAGVSCIGFLGFAHPSEVVETFRGSLLLPEDLFAPEWLYEPFGLLDVGEPKTRYTGPKRQHARFGDKFILRFLHKMFGHLSPTELLYPWGSRAFRSRWNFIFNNILGVSIRQDDGGVTPGCLRGSGATHAYLAGLPVADIAWRGRWRNPATLAHYVQEAAGLSATVLGGLPAGRRGNIRFLSSLAERVMAGSLY